MLPVIIASDCTGEEPLNIPPEVKILNENNLEFSDTSFYLGDKIQLIINAKEKIYPIVKFKIELKNAQKNTLADTNFNVAMKEFNFKLFFYKSGSNTDTIIVYVTDTKGLTTKKTLLIHLKGSQYKPLLSLSNILLGARLYPGNKSFLSVFNDSALTYDLMTAYNYQSRIDFFYYFYNQKYVMASPGAVFEPDLFSGATPKYDVNNWPLRNRTLYKKSMLSILEFEKMSNDSFLKNNSDFINASDKLSMKTGDIYLFSTEQQKLGIMKINALHGQDSGYIVIDLKIQK